MTPTSDRNARLDLASLIRQARMARGLTQEALAIQLGFANYKPLWLIETGRMAVPPEKVEALEEILGFPRNSLLWKECRCRLLRLGFDVDRALETEEATPAVAPEPPATAGQPGDNLVQPGTPAMPERRDVLMGHVETLTQETDLRREIGQMVRRHREALKYSQDHVAQLAGFKNKKPLWLIEDGRMAIPADRIVTLATALEMDPHDLILPEVRCRLLAAGFDLQAILAEAERRLAVKADRRASLPALEDPLPTAGGPAR